jgi:hypothetical protein
MFCSIMVAQNNINKILGEKGGRGWSARIRVSGVCQELYQRGHT